MKIEERIDSVLITVPREMMITTNFYELICGLMQKYGRLRLREYSDNPKDFTTTLLLDKEV